MHSAFAASTPYLNVPPDKAFLRALDWLREAGLEKVSAHSYVSEMQSPLSPELREGLAYCFSMFWGGLESRVSRDDWDAYRRLCSPESEEFVADKPDYYGFLTYTLFSGQVP